jgi:hypothetical protein
MSQASLTLSDGSISKDQEGIEENATHSILDQNDINKKATETFQMGNDSDEEDELVVIKKSVDGGFLSNLRSGLVGNKSNTSSAPPGSLRLHGPGNLLEFGDG